VVKARGMRRGKVVAGAVPDSFTGVPGMGSPKNEGPKGFLEILFGKNPNKGKVRRCAAFDSIRTRFEFVSRRSARRLGQTRPNPPSDATDARFSLSKSQTPHGTAHRTTRLCSSACCLFCRT
jgi:hypothetical protein